MSKYNLESIEQKITQGQDWGEIAAAVNAPSGEAIRRAYYRLKKKDKEIREKMEAAIASKSKSIAEIQPVPTSDYPPQEPVRKKLPLPRKRRKPQLQKTQYQEVTKGDLFDLVVEALDEKFELDSKLLDRLRKGYPQAPFGGKRKTKDGGWNSITYAIFEIILASKRVYVKKGEKIEYRI